VVGLTAVRDATEHVPVYERAHVRVWLWPPRSCRLLAAALYRGLTTGEAARLFGLLGVPT
jgi:hypothetical protein